jgi:hypothetical protein
MQVNSVFFDAAFAPQLLPLVSFFSRILWSHIANGHSNYSSNPSLKAGALAIATQNQLR